VEEARAATRQGAKDNPAVRRRKSELGLGIGATRDLYLSSPGDHVRFDQPRTWAQL
jgi:hypothetical protein